MINRDNYFAVKEYLDYRRQYDLLDDASVRVEESWLQHLLEWAGPRSFADAPKIQPPYPIYLRTARRDGRVGPLSRVYLTKLIRTAKRFFRWLAVRDSQYRKLSAVYLDTLKVPPVIDAPMEREAVTIEEVRAIAQADVQNLREQRIRAVAVFLFLSGMRVGAFSTLTLETVDLDNLAVKQWPSKGVRTKNRKHATTYLLDIPDLLEVAREWDSFLRAYLPPTGLWFAALEPASGELDLTADIKDVGKHRHVKVRRDLRAWATRVGLPYHSPHKFRHGHATYSLEQANSIADLKAISQNLMHSNLKTTDEIYAILGDGQVRERIMRLGRNGSDGLQDGSNTDIAAALRSLADQVASK